MEAEQQVQWLCLSLIGTAKIVAPTKLPVFSQFPDVGSHLLLLDLHYERAPFIWLQSVTKTCIHGMVFSTVPSQWEGPGFKSSLGCLFVDFCLCPLLVCVCSLWVLWRIHLKLSFNVGNLHGEKKSRTFATFDFLWGISKFVAWCFLCTLWLSVMCRIIINRSWC